MQKYLKLFTPIFFFMFILWIIYDADLDRKNFLVQLGHSIPFGDKVAHCMLYGLMALFLNISLDFRSFSFSKRHLLTGSMTVLTFAIAEEFTQLAFASRTFDTGDMVADVLGIYLVSFIYRKALNYKTLRN